MQIESNRKSRLMRLCGLFVLSLTLVGCGQSEPTATPGKRAEQPGELHQPGKWAKELAELNQQIALLQRKDLDADRKKIVKWLKTRPEYEASGESRFGNAWARFTDGRMVVIPFVHAGMRGGTPAWAASTTQDPPTGTSNVRFLVPVSRQARLLTADFDGLLYPPLVSPVALLKEYLSPAGYTALEEKATVTALKAVQGDGIFYIDTHAFSWPNRQGKEVFGFATSLGPAASEEDLESGRLIYLKTGGSGGSLYLITAQFVRQYMSFGENAFVFINACGSESNEPFRKAFLEKGAAFYAGWTLPVSDVSANIVSKFLFDRLLGANLFSLEREDPKQRPFNYMLVWMDMQQRQYDLDRFRPWDDPDVRGSQPIGAPPPPPPPPRPAPRAQLRIHHAGMNGHGGVRPIITGMYVDVFKEELLINGAFGAMPDEVTVGGKPLTVKQFIDGGDVVICALPPSGEGSAGPVIAKVRGKASNVVPLTEWRIRFRYTEELTEFEPPLKRIAVIDVHLRLDMHAFRVAPHSTPIGLPPGALLAASDSKVQWRFSGAGKNKALTFPQTHALSGSGSMTSGEGLANQKGVLTFEGGIDPSKKAFLKTRLFVIVHKAGVERVTSPASEYDSEVPLSFRSPGTDMFLDANLGIRAGSVTWEADNSKMNLEWDDAPALFAPTADTLARAVPNPDRDEEAPAAASKGQTRDTATIAETRPSFTAKAVRTSRTPDSAAPRDRAPTSGPRISGSGPRNVAATPRR